MVFLVGLSPDAEARSLNDVMRDAVQARDAGDLERTVTLLREAHKIQPAPEILNNLGKILELMGRYREAYDAYKLVADDPNADQSLRALDSSRLGALQPKLNKAWLLPKLTPEDATVLVDGEPTGLPPGIEFGVTHGQHAIQVEHHDIGDILIRHGRFPVDMRTEFVVDLRKPGESLARLDLGPRPRPKEIRINGKAVAGDLDRPGSVLLLPGTYDVVAVGAFDAFGREKVTLRAGDVAHLPKVDLATSAGDRASSSGRGPIGGQDSAPVVSISREKIEKPTSFMDVAPWVGAGLGAATTGVGALLMASVQKDKNTLVKDLQGSAGSNWLVDGEEVSTTGLSYAEAQAEQDRLDQANQRATLVMGVGAGVLMGSLVWSFITGGVDDELADSGEDGLKLSPLVMSPSGLTFGGRF